MRLRNRKISFDSATTLQDLLEKNPALQEYCRKLNTNFAQGINKGEEKIEQSLGKKMEITRHIFRVLIAVSASIVSGIRLFDTSKLNCSLSGDSEKFIEKSFDSNEIANRIKQCFDVVNNTCIPNKNITHAISNYFHSAIYNISDETISCDCTQEENIFITFLFFVLFIVAIFYFIFSILDLCNFCRYVDAKPKEKEMGELLYSVYEKLPDIKDEIELKEKVFRKFYEFLEQQMPRTITNLRGLTLKENKKHHSKYYATKSFLNFNNLPNNEFNQIYTDVSPRIRIVNSKCEIESVPHSYPTNPIFIYRVSEEQYCLFEETDKSVSYIQFMPISNKVLDRFICKVESENHLELFDTVYKSISLMMRCLQLSKYMLLFMLFGQNNNPSLSSLTEFEKYELVDFFKQLPSTSQQSSIASTHRQKNTIINISDLLKNNELVSTESECELKDLVIENLKLFLLRPDLIEALTIFSLFSKENLISESLKKSQELNTVRFFYNQNKDDNVKFTKKCYSFFSRFSSQQQGQEVFPQGQSSTSSMYSSNQQQQERGKVKELRSHKQLYDYVLQL